MRFEAPLIVGAGPAGCAAGLALAMGGVRATILERQRETGDAICGGFLSWRTLKALESIGVGDLGGHPIDTLHVFAGDATASASLPAGAVGVSRLRLDTVMQSALLKAGGAIERGVNVRGWTSGTLSTDAGEHRPETLFLASGKHDLRGLPRPRTDDDPAMGLRVRIAPSPALSRTLNGRIELHLFDGGYVGLLLQEDGSANFCLAVRKSRLTATAGDPARLLAELADTHPAIAGRLDIIGTMPPIDAIAAVPYGWRATTTETGVFRLGDQAAVIPSLAGEGIGIGVASGIAAAGVWRQGGAAAAPDYQRDFARRTLRPVSSARLLWNYGEKPSAARLATRTLAAMPFLARLAARMTRIGD
jgi:menaquinone-9 beta-reductase